MKHFKNFTSLLMGWVMILAMATTALAADPTGSITVDNPISGQTYTAYKIFIVTYDTGKTSYAYSIAGSSAWYSTVNAYAQKSGSGLTLTKAASEDMYAVTIDKNFSAVDFAAALKAANVTAGGIALTLDNPTGKASVTGLDLGYYFVTSASGAICNLTTTNPDVTIYDKNDKLFFEKTGDKSDVELGEVVSYVITSEVPCTTGFTSYTYEINDTMTEGLTFNKDVKVSVNGAELNGDFTVTNADNGFKLTIAVMNLQDDVTKTIEVKYTATVNEKAVATISKNKATLTYSDNPADKTSEATTPVDEENVYSAKIIIDKYETGSNNKKLPGAQFVLLNRENKYYKYTAATDTKTAEVEWVENQNEATVVTTDVNGFGEFPGLKNGTYSLREIKAPDGYNLLDQDTTITFNNIEDNVTVASLSQTGTVANNTGTILPSTGGIGTTIFYIIGGVLVLGAVVLLVTRKRMSIEKD